MIPLLLGSGKNIRKTTHKEDGKKRIEVFASHGFIWTKEDEFGGYTL